jgi:3-methylcrotonyl-CoA carboxylase alpha subunit/geranyl-CoA carboxylase alpha subunit
MPVTRLLVANRGEIARRIIRTAHGMGITTVAVYSDADHDALHVREATAACPLQGNTSAETYLCVDKLIAACQACGADAVHPGYGFLSENADFAQAVLDAGLVWVGPPPAAIRAVGSKSGAKQIAMAHGVPCLPGYFGGDQSDERLAAEATRIGWPVMVKAVAGGGGRGMRLVTEAAQLLSALRSARSEALSAFGSNELLLERALLSPRHVEVQVFADAHGHCIHLGERDCSVQRRHQKLVEETPSPAVSSALRERMGRCAVDLALAAGYVGAGTVEFLVEGDAFFLMEMNTRLQVEHPVTEMVTGLDLVEWQIRVARGEALPLAQSQVAFSGHAVEVRLCAEDDGFMPQTGVVTHFTPPSGLASPSSPGLRFDHALEAGQAVSPYYDSMLGKLVVHAATRDEAIDRLAAALDDLCVLGLPTNRAFLAACLRHPVFRAGQALIPFLQEHGESIRTALRAAELAQVLPFGLAALAVAAPELACPFPRPVRLRHRGELHEATLLLGGHPSPGQGRVVADAGPRGRHIQGAGIDLFVQDASYDPPAGGGGAAAAGELRAPFNGKVIAIKAAVGDAAAQGDVLVVLESMKLEHGLAAARVGRVASVAVQIGQQVAPGQLLVTLALPAEQNP